MQMEMQKKFTMGDGITSLVYASSINVVIAKGFEQGISEFTIISIFFVIYLFTDWVGRITTFFEFDEEDQLKRNKYITQIMKSFLEIVISFLIIAFYISMKEEKSTLYTLYTFEVDKYHIFGILLLIGLIWHLLVIKFIMSNLRIRDLFKHNFTGRVLNISGLEIYVERFTSSLQEAQIEARKIQQSDTEYFEKIRNVIWNVLVLSLGRTFAQLLSSHITLMPLFLGMVLISNLFIDMKLFPVESLGSDFFWAGLLGIFIFPTIIYIFIHFFYPDNLESINNPKLANFFLSLAGILIIISLTVFYFSFEKDTLLYIIITQQIVFGIVIRSVTIPKIK